MARRWRGGPAGTRPTAGGRAKWTPPARAQGSLGLLPQPSDLVRTDRMLQCRVGRGERRETAETGDVALAGTGVDRWTMLERAEVAYR